MVRRVLFYVLIGAAIYFGYQQYLKSNVVLHEAISAEQAEENRRALSNSNKGGSEVEKALRRRETTESEANAAEAAR